MDVEMDHLPALETAIETWGIMRSIWKEPFGGRDFLLSQEGTVAS